MENDSLWENPSVIAAKEAMTPEQLADLERQGEYMFSNNFETTTNMASMNESMLEALAYIRESLKSGQHPSTLNANEKALLNDAHGEDWLKEFGYLKEDLDSIVTVTMKLDQ
jgi:hypothetical protein